MNARKRRSQALLVSRRSLSLAVGFLVLALLTVLILLVRVHSRQLPAVDDLELELAAGLLSLALLGTAFLPLRFSHMNRRLERTLGKLETGTVRAGENPLGPLGNAFQEHYRLLWRGNRLKEGSIGVHELLLQTLIAQHTGRLVVTDGQGRVRYVSAPMEDSVTIGSGIPLASEP